MSSVPPAPALSAAMSTGLLTDHYELTMVQAALRDGHWQRRCVFEVFARRLPPGRRYGVVAGTQRFVEALDRFRFEPDQLTWLADQTIVDEQTLRWLAGFRFSGNVWAYDEGEVYLPGSPLLVVEAPFAEAVLLETLALSVFNHDCAVAAAASRMAMAAQGRPLIEMGSRRTHEHAAVAAARAAFIAGFESTSNLQAGRQFGIPTRGTSAHAFTLLHDSEQAAFESQVAALGNATTLLVDTFDIATGVATGVRVAGPELAAVRIDSGDLAEECRSVRRQLDELGATDTTIVVTGDLDEHAIAALQSAPADAYGVGTSLVTGSGHPTAGLVYKMVARSASNDPTSPMLGVAKRSVGKPSIAGRKFAFRQLDQSGHATAEIIRVDRSTVENNERPLLRQVVKGGEVVANISVRDARVRHFAAIAELPPDAHRLSAGEPVIPTRFEEPS